MTFGRITLAALASAGLAFGATMSVPAAAQQSETQQQVSFSDEELQSFAEAAVKLSKIRSEYQAQMGNTATEEERQKLTQQTNQRMAQAVEETPGITIAKYNQIVAASQNDEEMSQKINQYMQEGTQ